MLVILKDSNEFFYFMPLIFFKHRKLFFWTFHTENTFYFTHKVIKITLIKNDEKVTNFAKTHKIVQFFI